MSDVLKAHFTNIKLASMQTPTVNEDSNVMWLDLIARLKAAPMMLLGAGGGDDDDDERINLNSCALC